MVHGTRRDTGEYLAVEHDISIGRKRQSEVFIECEFRVAIDLSPGLLWPIMAYYGLLWPIMAYYGLLWDVMA